MSQGVQTKLLASLFAILFLWLIRRVVLLVVTRQTSAVKVQYRWRKTTSYIAFAIAILLIGRIWFEGFKAVSTYLGIVSAGIAIALRDPLVNLLQQRISIHLE